MTTKIGLVVAVGLVVAACGSSDDSGGSDRPRVLAALYPLEFVAHRVGADVVDVEGITPAGVEPHDIELTASQVRDLTTADLVVYIGRGFQPAVDDVVSELDDRVVLDVLEGKDLLASPPDKELDVDPHVWLDPTIMSSIAEQVAARLADIDSAHEGVFLDNAEKLEAELARLDLNYADGLASCRTRELVTSHEAFGYLAARYDLEQVGIAGVDPEGEPTPERLAQVAQFVEAQDVTTIFFEELGTAEIAETLARETGADVDVLATLEAPPDEGDYLDAMHDNLVKIRKALSCE